jgi:bacterioferritin-associated ferredoxin
MALDPDDTVCFCFHVPLRKIESFCAREKPKAASQISECLAAGTGCGWCIPMLRRIHLRICGEYRPWWKEQAPGEEPGEYHSAARDATDDAIDPAAYAAGRQEYLAVTKRKPPEKA